MYFLSASTRRFSALAIVAMSTLAACGGGGSSPTPGPTAAPTVAPTPTATPVLTGPTPPTPAAGNGYALFYFQLSTSTAPNAKLRRPDFVAPNTQSVTITTTGPNAPTGGSGTPNTGATQTTTFASGNTNCNTQGTALVCYAYVQVPVGSGYSFQLYTYANGAKLAQANTGTTTITSAGSTQQQMLTFAPIVSSVSLSFASPTTPKGTAAAVPLTVVLKDAAGNDLSKDASGAAIAKGSSGDTPFASPVSLTSSDTTNAPVSIGSLTKPSDLTGITVNYDGSGGPFTFTGTANGGATGTATLTPQ